jgi:hypothetical protein
MAKKIPSDLRASLLKLSEACPFHTVNPADCPLYPLRKMGRQERVQYINALSESEMQYLADYHKVCFRIKRTSKA